LGGELLQRKALLHQPGKRRCFFQGRQILPLDVFHGGEAQPIVSSEAGADVHRHGIILRQCAAFLQQLQRLIPALAADEAVAGLLALELKDHEVLQQAVRLDAGGKALDAGRVYRRARVALGRENGGKG
jgi:hypothetical protein